MLETKHAIWTSLAVNALLYSGSQSVANTNLLPLMHKPPTFDTLRLIYIYIYKIIFLSITIEYCFTIYYYRLLYSSRGGKIELSLHNRWSFETRWERNSINIIYARECPEGRAGSSCECFYWDSFKIHYEI